MPFVGLGYASMATYPARRPFLRIDYVLASEAWEVAGAGTEWSRLSDHRAHVATLQLKAPSGAGTR